MIMRSVAVALSMGVAASSAVAQEPLAIRPDNSEAEAALSIMRTVAESGEPTTRQWQALESSRPYVRLKQREAAFNVGFTDADFRTFLTSPDQLARHAALEDALRRWTAIDMTEAGRRAFAYLPEGARLEAEVYFMIKPRKNSFVWDVTGEPAIFLYLDPAQEPALTENFIAHELHHIGLGRACRAATVEEPTRAASLRRWSGAFAEGLAMIAAAGGPDIHPHADSPAETRAVWDANVARFDEDLRTQDAFFTAMLRGEPDDAAVNATMRGYFGEQGPWYTVGWKMAQTIERASGREALVDAFCRFGSVFGAYNDAARRLNASGESLPLWSDAVVSAMTPAF